MRVATSSSKNWRHTPVSANHEAGGETLQGYTSSELQFDERLGYLQQYIYVSDHLTQTTNTASTSQLHEWHLCKTAYR